MSAPPEHASSSRELALVAHDLRGPIGVTRGHARLLLDGLRGPLNEQQRRSIEAIERQADRLDRMIDEIEREGTLRREPESGSRIAVADVERERMHVIVADDDDEVCELLRELLSDRYEVTVAHDGSEALERLRSHHFDLAIVDLGLPKLDGFQVAEQIAKEDMPPAFMFLSAEAAPEAKVKGLNLGAADYVTKPFDPAELLARIARIAAAVEREQNLRADALTDPLTGLANYRNLAHSLHRELERARRYDLPLALITIDLDDLKRINDEGGHAAGNEAIATVARILKNAVRKFETVARQGGDEFAVLLPNTSSHEALTLAERLRAEVAKAQIRGRPLSISLGVAAREKGDASTDVRSLVEASDEALYRAKRRGRNRVAGPDR
jgi:two-component system cell cycle response regulator